MQELIRAYFGLESNLPSHGLKFTDLQARLINKVNNRIMNGDFTERGLARILGVSQPQIHNVLKGARKLTPELGDRLLGRLHMNLLDLLDPEEIESAAAQQGLVSGGHLLSSAASSSNA